MPRCVVENVGYHHEKRISLRIGPHPNHVTLKGCDIANRNLTSLEVPSQLQRPRRVVEVGHGS